MHRLVSCIVCDVINNHKSFMMMSSTTGDYEGAIDTLRMAITLIKQSITASSESSQVWSTPVT